MLIDVVLPQLGESMTEATIGRWLKRVGESVAEYEPLVEVETDKVAAEVPAIRGGVLHEILAAEGATVPVGALLARISTADAAIPGASPHEARARRPAGPPITPVVARLVAAHDIDLSQVPGTGAGGRVSKKDILRYLAAREAMEPPAGEPVAPAPPTNVASAMADDGVLMPLSATRRAIAEHMTRSLAEAPQATTVFEVDMGRVLAHREGRRALLAQQGIQLTITAYIIEAVAAALRHIPALNTRYTDQGMIANRHAHIGVAVALDDGLIVPVLRDADQKNLAGIAHALHHLVERARSRRLQPDEVAGGTFTISNHGVNGSLFATPILNRGQSGILGVGAIVKRPIVVSQEDTDAIAIRPMCYLSLTFDHRAVDGATADAFLAAVKQTLETYVDR